MTVPTSLPPVPKRLAERGVSLRLRAEADADFIRDVYIAYRWDEIAMTGWPEATRLAFLHDQHRLQDLHYAKYYEEAALGIIEVDGERAGRLYLLHRRSDLRIVDIALMPAHRNQGLGSGLIAAVQAQARDLKAEKVSIHVEQFNPALRLYERLGFRPVEPRGVYIMLEWAVA